jgi:hypothetical protein
MGDEKVEGGRRRGEKKIKGRKERKGGKGREGKRDK